MITDYTTLQSAMVEWLARDNDATLVARIPTFIQLLEAQSNRELFVRQMESRATTIIDTGSSEPEFISLPSDFQSMRRVRVSSATGKPHLDYKPGVQLDEYRTTRGDATGQPQFFTIFGTEMELAPTPDSDYTIEMIYRATIPPLSSNSTNWLLTLAPDYYLYGSLLHSAPYINKDERIQTWGLGFKTALDGLNNLSLSSTFNAGPLVMRPSGVTP